MKNDFENDDNALKLQNIVNNVCGLQGKIEKEEKKEHPDKSKIRSWKFQLNNLQKAIDRCREKTSIYA